MQDIEQIKALVRAYQDAIHTQNEADFRQLWTKGNNQTLISVATCYEGIDQIYAQFLIDGIHQAYESIDLIAEKIDVHLIDEKTAIVIFSYHTECLRRGSLEPYSMAGLETQVVRKEDQEWRLQHVHYSKK